MLAGGATPTVPVPLRTEVSRGPRVPPLAAWFPAHWQCPDPAQSCWAASLLLVTLAVRWAQAVCQLCTPPVLLTCWPRPLVRGKRLNESRGESSDMPAAVCSSASDPGWEVGPDPPGRWQRGHELPPSADCAAGVGVCPARMALRGESVSLPLPPLPLWGDLGPSWWCLGSMCV